MNDLYFVRSVHSATAERITSSCESLVSVGEELAVKEKDCRDF